MATVRSRLGRSLVVIGLLAVSSPGVVLAATRTTPAVESTTTTSATTVDPAGSTSMPGAATTVETTTTLSTTTTTTLPSAVTTVPEGCPLPPTAQAVFVGTVQAMDPVSANFAVSRIRAGSLEGYAANNSVEVRYGADVKFLEQGSEYIVGVALDPVTQKLSSTVRDAAELFGGNEVAGGGAQCPSFEAAARTLHTDGSSIESGVFSNFLGDPLRLVAALVIPSALLFVLLLALVWARRAARRQLRP